MISTDISLIRHSLAHVLAAATKRLYGQKVKFGVGPATSSGFYYDLDLGDRHLVEEDLAAIEKEMRKIINEKQVFSCHNVTIAEAKQWTKDNNQPYKLELIEDFEQNGTTKAGVKSKAAVSGEMSFYDNGEFSDLCLGGHVANTSEIPTDAFRLTKIAGAYFRGDETKPMMQRVYGVAFATKTELAEYLRQQQEAKARDHRKLGRELDLYVTSELVGAGLPMFTPRGTILRDEIARVSTEERAKIGFEKVWTPHMTKKDLYEKSGHWAKFGSELFLVKSQETGDQFVLKPMNCPHHGRIYASKVRSYRDMPQRYMEVTTDYRDEKSGELGGLARVRALTQDDSHDFCRPDQIETEIANLLAVVQKIYQLFDMKLRVRLSYRDDSESYLGSAELWQSAQRQLKQAVQRLSNIDYYEATGEAAFYGPKIDFMATDALGREHQLATAQLDFVQPDRFALEYIDQEGVARRPVMIHCALLGSLERFLSVYIEHTAGKFPVWLAPEQLRVIKVKSSPAVDQLISELVMEAKQHQVRYIVDDSNNSVSKKIRAAELYKVPYVVVIGDKEADSGKLGVRIRKDIDSQTTDQRRQYSPAELTTAIQTEHDNHSKHTTM